MPVKPFVGAQRSDNGCFYSPENLHLLRVGEDASRELPPPGMSPEEVLASPEILEALQIPELATAIAYSGSITPLDVREDGGTGIGIIVDGRRRYFAARLINLDPSKWKDRDGKSLASGVSVRYVKSSGVDDEQALEMSIIKNLQRLDLDVVDRANSARKAIQLYGWTNERVASVIGCSSATVTGLMKIAKLPKQTKLLMKSGEISFAAGKVLATLPEGEAKRYTAEIENGGELKKVMAKITEKKRNKGAVISRSRAEFMKALEGIGSVRAELVSKWMGGQAACSLSDILSDGDLPENWEELIGAPEKVEIAGNEIEVFSDETN